MQNSAQKIMQQHGKTFALAAKLLAPASRQAASELYAFARMVDDGVDLADNTKNRQFDLQKFYKNASAPMQSVLQQYAISDQLMQVFLCAQQRDADARQLTSKQELIDYAYGVAGSIGQMMRPILGVPQSAEIYAVSLGIAMQMTNIARDVVEDAQRARIYIPTTFFAGDISPQILQKPNAQQTQNIFAAIQKLLALADEYYAFAQQGYMHIPLRNRLSIAAAGAMYRAIGATILSHGAAKFWRGRVSLGLWQKSVIGISAVIKTLFNAMQQPHHKPAESGIAAVLKNILN